MNVSVIIVDYQAKTELKSCIKSLNLAKDSELIIIDNNKINRGFAKACNLGAKKARGKYLFFLNPDTIVLPGAIPQLLSAAKKYKASILGPQLLDSRGKPYLSFTPQPTPLESLIVYSFIDKWWPNNKLSKRFWSRGKSLSITREVGSLSGAALLVERELFMSLGGFDENMFMYWEDYDLCKRALDLQRKIIFYPHAQVIHHRARSTKSSEVSYTRFIQSREVFFRKHYGRRGLLAAKLLTLLEIKNR